MDPVSARLRAIAAEDEALRAEAAALVDELADRLRGSGLSAGLVAKLSAADLVEVGLATASGAGRLRAEQLDALEVALGCSAAGPAIMAAAAEAVGVLRSALDDGGDGGLTRVMPSMSGVRTTRL